MAYQLFSRREGFENMSEIYDAWLDARLDARPTLRAWLDQYRSIEDDYLAALQQRGIALAPRGHLTRETERVKARLRVKGACFRNGDARLACR